VAVNDGSDLKGLAVTHQAVGGFAIESSEMSFAVNDCNSALGWDEPTSRRRQVSDLR
jgi:hypothetical protein